jgi:predicted membrane protein (TIGR00267 family)
MEKLSNFLSRIRLYVQVTHLGDIARRYFVMNGFDGSMTVLGVILGAWIVGVENPNIIVMTGLGACMAMGVSGFFGAYLAEKAERTRRLKTLEEAMLSDLDGSIQQDAHEFAPALAALIDGLSPALTAVVSLVPFILSILGVLPIWDSYFVSCVLTFVTLFALGLYLGRIAKERMWLYGFQMLAAGIVIAVLVFLIGGAKSI